MKVRFHMKFIQTSKVKLHYVEHGKGDNIVVFIHGNLACVNWMDLVLPHLPENIHYFAIDWRGCGQSEKPLPTNNYDNYSMEQHAEDMIEAIVKLGIDQCHLANHSTGGIICTHMMVMAPKLFNKVLSLDPVGPKGLDLSQQTELFQNMKNSRDLTYSVMATAAPTLFQSQSLQDGTSPQFASTTTSEQQELYDRLIDKAMTISDGIWLGVPINLTQEYKSGKLSAKQKSIIQPHLILWGEYDQWIPKAHLDEMVDTMPNCTLQVLKGVGHSCNLENPNKLTEIMISYFSE